MADTVRTTGGDLRGLRVGGHLAYRGIPFAAPPEGPLRFTAPQPAAPWSGVRDADAFGPVAPQDPLVPPPYRAVAPESEDCLSLNVYTPGVDDARRPVLFWIHGGGFSHGAGSQPTYDGGPLVERGDVVVVTINYRLGALGFLSLGHRGGAEWGATANAGSLDQVAALRWVRDNIARFGGDPDNVTIFGQSAGGVAVSTLLAMPAARGLFAKAIAQSGTAAHLAGVERAEAIADRYLQAIGIPDADRDALRAISWQDLLAAQGSRGALSPFVDGHHVPRPLIEVIGAGELADIPLMIGTTRDEQKLYMAAQHRAPLSDDDLCAQVSGVLPRRAVDRAAEVIACYRASRTDRGLPASNLDILDAIATTSRFRLPALRVAEAYRQHQPSTFVYEFDYSSPARGGAMGACHGLEVPFVFGAIGRGGDDRLTGSGPEVERLQGEMMDAWIAFARTGAPGHAGIGDWPAYDTAERHTMVFDLESGARPAPFDEERAIWQSMVTKAPA